MLTVNGLVKRFGGFTAVNNVSFRVEQGEILGLIGPNGSGKSTINMLSGKLVPTRVRSVRRRELAGVAPTHHQPRIGRTFHPAPFNGSASSRKWRSTGLTARAPQPLQAMSCRKGLTWSA